MSNQDVTGRTPEQWREIALSQAETLDKQATDIRGLIRERDAAKEDRHGALLLAATYADKAGVTIEPPHVEEWLGRYHERLDSGARELDKQRGQLTHVLGIAGQLQQLGAGQRRFRGTVTALVARIADELNRVATVQAPKAARQMFETPTLPASEQRQPTEWVPAQQSDAGAAELSLFGGAS